MGAMEEKFSKFVGNAGSICTLVSLFSLIIFAGVSVLMRYYGFDFAFLRLIVEYAPAIAATAGGVASVTGYYGYFRIVRRKQKASAKDEAKGEAEGQVEEALQSLPDTLSSMPGCFSSVSNVALGASLAVSSVVYVPEVNSAFNGAINMASAFVEDFSQLREDPTARYTINGRLNLSTGASGKKARAELLLNRVVVKSVETDEEGNYTFEDVPKGSYMVRGRMDGVEEDAYSAEFALGKNTYMPELTWPPPAAIDTTKWEAYAWYPDEQGRYADMFVPGIGMVAISLSSDVAKKYGLNKIGQKGALIDSRRKEAAFAAAMAAEGGEGQPGEPEGELYSTPQHPLVLALPKPVVFVIPQPEPEPAAAEPQARAERKRASGFFVGVGSEVNSNAPQGTAIGLNVALGYDMGKNFALGAGAVYSSDTRKASALEPTAALRYYLPLAQGLYAQAEAGGVLTQEDGKSSLQPLYGTAAGWKLGMENNWFVEPALRVGYPMVWGTGVKVGKNFP